MLNKEKENIVFYPPKELDQKNSNVFVKTNLKLQKDTCCCKKRALAEGQKKSNHKKSNEVYAEKIFPVITLSKSNVFKISSPCFQPVH